MVTVRRYGGQSIAQGARNRSRTQIAKSLRSKAHIIAYLSIVVQLSITQKPITMKKFERLNKLTNAKETYIGATGVLKSLDETARLNKVSKKPYFRFTAEVDTPNGSVTIGGQLYEALIPFLGSSPSIGDKLEFNCKLSDLQSEQSNVRWGIGGSAVDSVDSILDMLKDL
jgi:hypothetical protein